MRRRAAVLGSPIAHSLSPVLHRAAYAALGLDWAYDVVECDARSLPAVLDAFAAAPRPGYAGASLTMPLKRAALELVDERAPTAELLGAVNTVLFADGRRVGHNTDVSGLVDAVREAGFAEPPVSVVVLGGGGAARAAIGALARIGVTTATVVLRDMGKGGPIVDVGERLGVAVAVEEWTVSYGALRAADLVVSTTPPGATDELAGAGWSPSTALVDVVYAPWPTRLAAVAADAGASVVGGLAMLVGQAAEAVELMTGCRAPVAAMRAAGEAALRRSA